MNILLLALFNTISSRKFLLTLDLVISVVRSLNTIVLFFQTEKLNYPMLNGNLNKSIKDLEKIIQKNWDEKFNKIKVKMVFHNDDFNEINSLKRNYVKKTIQSLKDRFP